MSDYKNNSSRETRDGNLAVLYLERMAAGKLPYSDRTVDEDSDLNNIEVVRAMYYIRDVINELSEKHKTISKNPARKQFPIECLQNYQYEKDHSIMTFVSQLKELAGTSNSKGMSTKKITDWLKEKGYLHDEIDSMNGEKHTEITEQGEEAGLYIEVRTTRFGQEYPVIMYSEKAQKWIVENMNQILYS